MTEQELFTLLSTDAGINALTTQVFNGDLPEAVSLPAVTIEYVNDTPVNTLGGDSGKTRKRYTISAWASTYAGAWALTNEIQTAMSGHPRLVTIPLHEEDIGLFRFASDYSIFE